VLDEPTAAVDPLEERMIYNAFKKLAENKTALLVTHRLGAAQIADRIIVLNGGRVAEEGRHEDLMARDGIYAEMFNAQAQWYESGNYESKGGSYEKNSPVKTAGNG
jgi:ATP-binding cassette subfamily B protein